MKDIIQYLDRRWVTHEQVEDVIHSTLLKNDDILNLVILHKETLRITDEIEELWKAKIMSLNEENYANPKAIYLAFKVFIDELQRLRSIIINNSIYRYGKNLLK